MKNLVKVLLPFALLFSFQGYSLTDDLDKDTQDFLNQSELFMAIVDQEFEGGGKACKGIGLTPEQMMKIKDAVFQFKRDKIKLSSAIKLARLDYIDQLFNPETNYESAMEIGVQISSKVQGIAQATVTLASSILFKILAPEQRYPAIKCLKKMKAKRKGRGYRRGGRRGHHLVPNK